MQEDIPVCTRSELSGSPWSFTFTRRRSKSTNRSTNLIFGAANVLVALGMTGGSTDTSQKFSGTKRLGQVIVSAQIKRLRSCSFQRVRAEITIIGVMLQERTCSISFKPSISGKA